VILAFDLNLYLPISRVDENMRRAQTKDAVLREKFYFRRAVAEEQRRTVLSKTKPRRLDPWNETSPVVDPADPSARVYEACCDDDDFLASQDDVSSYEEMSCAEIIDGKGDYFPGLAPLAYAYLEHIGCDRDSLATISRYVEHVRRRARGDLPTPARWIRDFVAAHPDYQGDGHLSEKLTRDLAVACHDVGVGKRPAPELLGADVQVRPITADGAWDVKLSGLSIPNHRKALLEKYTAREPFLGYEEHPGGYGHAGGEDLI